jgi:CheY-like chemotaxis protein
MSLQSVHEQETGRNSPLRRAEFDQWVRSALNHLYDVPYLQAHPLTHVVAADDNRTGRSRQLREALLWAIDAMRPLPGVQVGTAIWRGYRLLELRYIEGITPAETMAELALSRSQFYKEQARMVDAMVDLLWQRYGAVQAAPPPPAPPMPDLPLDPDQPVTRQEAARSELQRLAGQSRPRAVDLGEVLVNLQPLLDSLTKVRNVELRCSLTPALWIDHADRVMARQAILSVLTYALDLSHYGHVEVTSFREARAIGLAVRAVKAPPGYTPLELPVREGVGLAVAQQLLAAMHGTLSFSDVAPGEWHARLAWQAADTPLVFVVDDNEDFVRLVSRFLAGCRCRVAGVTSVAQAREFLRMTPVDVILSDVMMPDEDGWEFLAFAKSTPQTTAVPFVVCSVLHEPQLARAHGAAASLTKPLTPEALLGVLARWIEMPPPTPSAPLAPPSNPAPAHPAPPVRSG